jgi:hypothetical protein
MFNISITTVSHKASATRISLCVSLQHIAINASYIIPNTNENFFEVPKQVMHFRTVLLLLYFLINAKYMISTWSIHYASLV